MNNTSTDGASVDQLDDEYSDMPPLDSGLEASDESDGDLEEHGEVLDDGGHD